MKKAFQSFAHFLFCIRGLLIFLFLAGITVFYLPNLLHMAVNRWVIPHYISDPKIPLTAGSIKEVTYNGLRASGFVVDPGEGILLLIPEVKATYSPQTLAKGEVTSVTGTMLSEQEVVFDAAFSATNIQCAADGSIEATLRAHCSPIVVEDYSIGPIDVETQVSGTSAAFDFDVPVLEGLMSANVAVSADWTSNVVYHCAVDLPLADAAGEPVQLGGLVPEVDDATLFGHVTANVAGEEEGGEVIVAVTVDDLELVEPPLHIENLQAGFEMRFPGEPQSLPEQLVTIERVTAGEAVIENVQMHYQLEPESVFYIENLEFDLCEGRVSLYDTRIHPESTDLATQLFCDRLSLAGVIEACGAKGFAAGGELNGRLPVVFKDGAISIDNGFLYTTPGSGGTFAMSAAEVTEGILPPGSLESGQLGLVSSALALFNYDWITMTLNSEGDSLLVVVEVSGRPENILPYEYDPRTGVYVKLSLKQMKPGRGTRQPMRFTLNLTVPLNQILSYATEVNRQWKLFTN